MKYDTNVIFERNIIYCKAYNDRKLHFNMQMTLFIEKICNNPIIQQERKHSHTRSKINDALNCLNFIKRIIQRSTWLHFER